MNEKTPRDLEKMNVEIACEITDCPNSKKPIKIIPLMKFLQPVDDYGGEILKFETYNCPLCMCQCLVEIKKGEV